MTRIFLIRHGEAEGNIYRRAQGQYEGRISPKGRRQIDALAERFRNEQIDALYSSDLLRAQQTAGAITKYHNVPLQLDSRLRELNIGVWEDVPFGNLSHDYPEMMLAFNDDPDIWHAEGAETFPQMVQRMRAAISDIAAWHDGEAVACVSHGMAIRMFIADILGIPSAEIYRVPHGDNTCVALLEADAGALRIVYYNDASHLTGDLSTFARQTWWQKPGTLDLNNVRFQRFDPIKYPGKYIEFYEKTWRAVHGSTVGFQPAAYLEAAVRHVKADPDAIVTIVRSDGEVAGIIELDTERDKADGAGWICLCFIEEACRRNLLGVQLIGHAVSVFRRLGRRVLRLSVYEGNPGAIRFYEAYDFRRVGETEGAAGMLYIMEKEL